MQPLAVPAPARDPAEALLLTAIICNGSGRSGFGSSPHTHSQVNSAWRKVQVGKRWGGMKDGEKGALVFLLDTCFELGEAAAA